MPLDHFEGPPRNMAMGSMGSGGDADDWDTSFEEESRIQMPTPVVSYILKRFLYSW